MFCLDKREGTCAVVDHFDEVLALDHFGGVGGELA